MIFICCTWIKNLVALLSPTTYHSINQHTNLQCPTPIELFSEWESNFFDHVQGCTEPFWNHYFIWWWLVICDKYGKAFRNICLLIGYDLNDLDASWGHHDAKCFNLQPEEINILNFILHEPLLKETLNEDEFALPLSQLMAEVSLDEVLARVCKRRGVCLCGNKSMQCFDYVYH